MTDEKSISNSDRNTCSACVWSITCNNINTFRYQDIQAGRIPTAVAAGLKAIIRKADHAQKKIQHIESRNEEQGADFEMLQKDVAELFRLHKQLEKFKTQFDMMKDPILRYDLVQLKQM